MNHDDEGLHGGQVDADNVAHFTMDDIKALVAKARGLDQDLGDELDAAIAWVADNAPGVLEKIAETLALGARLAVVEGCLKKHGYL